MYAYAFGGCDPNLSKKVINMMMSITGGTAMVRASQEIDPRVKVICMSGLGL